MTRSAYNGTVWSGHVPMFSVYISWQIESIMGRTHGFHFPQTASSFKSIFSPFQKKYKKFWEELISYFPWYDTGHIENDASSNSSNFACVFVNAVTFLPSRCLATMRFLPSRFLATIGDFYRAVAWQRNGIFTERLPSNDKMTFTGLLHSNDREDTHTQTATWSHKPAFIFSK
jgi:hypothetical protein